MFAILVIKGMYCVTLFREIIMGLTEKGVVL